MKPYTHFTLDERICLQNSLEIGCSLREIAIKLNRNVSSVSREVKRNRSVQKNHYNSWRATSLYIYRRRKCVRHFLIQPNTELYDYVFDNLSQFWTPEIIAKRGKLDGFNVSPSTIYNALYRDVFVGLTPKSTLRRRGKRRCGARSRLGTITPDHVIGERPIEANLRSRLGDLEGDTVYGGIAKGCLLTLIDRKTRLLIAVVCPNRTKETIEKAFKIARGEIVKYMEMKTITLDNGSEFAAHRQIAKDTNTTVYFADPHSPWQRGSNENINDVLRFFYPKGTNFLKVTQEELNQVVSLINNRPRKCLDYLSPLEFISQKCCT
ncbi:MAG: IS30 family transposase [Clostridia bacterium]